MKKLKLPIWATAALIIATAVTLESCRKIDDFFPEFRGDNIDIEATEIDGAIAMPILNTEFTIGNFIPDLDSTLWVEADANGLLHFRMFYPNVFTYKASEVFPGIPFPVPAGTTIPANLLTVETGRLELKIYNSSLEGHLFFKNPRITFSIRNEIPMVTAFRMDTISFFGEQQNSETANPTLYSIPAPAEEGGTASYLQVIDTIQVPDLPAVFSPVPHLFSMVLSTGTATNQVIPYALSGNEKVTIDADVDLSMEAYLADLVRVDSVAMDMNGATFGPIASATLRIELLNELPVGGFVRIFFSDSTASTLTAETNHVDSLFTDLSHPNVTEKGWELTAANVATFASGVVPTVNKFDITLDRARIQYLKDHNVTTMYAITVLNSKNAENQEYVKIAAALKMGLKVGIRADYETTVGEILDTINNHN